MNRPLIWCVLVAFCCTPCSLSKATTADRGPQEIILQSTIDPAKPANPAYFPHGAHQGRLECKTCHHGMRADGKRLSYVEGTKNPPV
jgi:hypothetical protein